MSILQRKWVEERRVLEFLACDLWITLSKPTPLLRKRFPQKNALAFGGRLGNSIPSQEVAPLGFFQAEGVCS